MFRLVNLFVLGVLALFLTACGGGNGGGSSNASQPDFSLSLTPATLTLQAGGNSQTFSVSATALNGFSGTINVTLSGLPNGVVAAPAMFTLTPGTPQQISLSAASTVVGGTSTVTVQATSGAITHTFLLSLTAQPVARSFGLSLNLQSVTLSIGGAAQQVSVTANAVGAFSSPVNVTFAGLPAGVTATPSSLTLTPGSAQTISLQAASSAVAGQTTLTLQATSGTLSQSATISLTVTAPPPDFQLFAGPSTLNVSTHQAQLLTIDLIPLNGFSGAATVTFSGLPTGVTVNSPLPLVADIAQEVFVGAYGSGATAGQSTITITATANGIVHSTQINLVITTITPDFHPMINGGTNLDANAPLGGLLLAPGTYTFSAILPAVGGPNGAGQNGADVTVTATGSVPGTTMSQTEQYVASNEDQEIFTITVNPSAAGERGVLQLVFTGPQSSHELDLPIYVEAQPTILSYVPPVTVRQGAGTDLLYEVASTSPASLALYLGQGWPQAFWLNPFLVDSNPELVSAGFGQAEIGEYSVSAGSDAPTGTITLPLEFAIDGASQNVSLSAQVVPFTDFNLTASPSTIGLSSGQTQTVTVSVAAVDGLSSPVNVSMDNLPAGVAADPQTFTLQPGDSQQVQLTAGTGYSAGGALTVDAASPLVSHAVQVAMSPGGYTGDVVVTGNDITAIGIAEIYTPGTYTAVTGLGDPAVNGVIGYIANAPPWQSDIGTNTSNCEGSTPDPGCTPVNLLIIGGATPCLQIRPSPWYWRTIPHILSFPSR